jgi:TadE-like protein
MKNAMRGSRGQALIETAVFLPMVLLLMTAVIYFSQYGVLQERAVQAVRYAALVSNGGSAAMGTANIFSLQQMYGELTREGQNSSESDPGYPLTGYACAGTGSSGADTAAALALNQQEPVPGGVGTAAPAPTFFQPDTTPVGTCTATNLPVPNGNVGLAASYLMVQTATISASMNAPSYIHRFLPNFPTQQTVTATMGFTLPAAPGPMMYCSQQFAALLAGSFASLPEVVPNVLSTPYGQYPVPPASPTPRPGC